MSTVESESWDEVGGPGSIAEYETILPDDYHDVKTLIGEAEFFSAHEADWLTRASDFGASLQLRTAEGAMISAAGSRRNASSESR